MLSDVCVCLCAHVRVADFDIIRSASVISIEHCISCSSYKHTHTHTFLCLPQVFLLKLYLECSSMLGDFCSEGSCFHPVCVDVVWCVVLWCAGV